MNKNTLKTIRINLIIFAILHFFCEVAMSVGTQSKPAVFGIFVQYWISSWILRTYIIKDETDIAKVSLYTWGVSIAVFLIRLLLGVLFLAIILGA